MQSLQAPSCGARAFSGRQQAAAPQLRTAALHGRPQLSRRGTVTAAGANGLSSLLDNVVAAWMPGAPAAAAAAPGKPTSPATPPNAAFAPPSVADTKRKFIESYKKPVAPMYNNVIQELLVQQHFIRYNIKYNYNEIYALGVVSVFEQVLDSYDEEERQKLFTAYMGALGEDGQRHRSDAAAIEALAKEAGSPEALVADANGNQLQRALASVAELSAANKFGYNKFFSIGLFRLLEITGAREPTAVDKLASVAGVRVDLVNKDLLLYKGILSKLSAAKEMMKEFLEREKRKQAEREAEKAVPSKPAAAEDSPAVPQQA